MKVLILNDYSYIAGGAEVYVNNLKQALNNSGHKALLVGTDRNINGKELIADEIIPASGNYFNIDSIFNFPAFKAIQKIADKFNPDLVHYNNIFYALSPSVLFALRKYRQVLSIHDYYLICNSDKLRFNNQACAKALKDCDCKNKSSLTKIFARLIAKYCLNSTIQLIAPSNFVSEQFKINNFKNLTTLSYPAFTNNYAGVIDIENSISFTFLGRLAYQKGVDLLITAFAKLNNSSAILNIIGAGPEEANLRELAQKLKVESQVIFHGWKNKQDINDLLIESIAIVIPSRWPEVYGLVLNEAASMGLPAIVSDIGALPELITHQKNGLIFNHSDSDDLCTQLSFALNNKILMKNYGLTALGQAKNNTTDHYLSKLFKIYGV